MKKSDKQQPKKVKKDVKLNLNENNKLKKWFLQKGKNISKKYKSLQLEKQKFNTLELILIMIITIFFGILIGNSFENNTGFVPGSTSKTSELDNAYQTILQDYYDTVDKDRLLEAAISGMLNYLGDDYSFYMNEETANDFEEKLEGVYYGIGAELIYNANNQTEVHRVFENAPAAKAGLKAGDIISKVNNVDVLGKLPADVSGIIKGNNNLNVNMVVLRDNKEVTLKIITTQVDIPSITSSIFEENAKKIGYIDISIFATNTALQFRTELEKLEKAGIDSLIIDVRDNSGGHLHVVKDILQMFLKKGDLMYQIKSKEKVTKYKDETDESRDYNVIVLTDGTSASGSEILASAFKETYKSEIIGQRTFGKGTVQTTKELSTGGIMKYTIQTWLTANGNEINKVGVSPTIEINLSEEYYKNPTVVNDEQLQKAIEILK